MTYKNAKTMTALSVIAVFAITSFYVSTNEAFAVSITNYKMAEDTYAKVTFTFRDGVEEVYFPVFKMTSSYIANSDAEFQLQGVVSDYPYLNEAMDYAYDFALASSAPHDYKQFLVDVDLIKGGITQKNIHYTDCRVSDAYVDTLSDKAEGYTTAKTGFAIIHVIDFVCTGVQQSAPELKQEITPYAQLSFTDYGKHSYKLAEDVHSYATFYFDWGTEKIDFPVFEINSGFSETSRERPTFLVEGIVRPHVLLDDAINKAKVNSGLPSANNIDFDVDVSFANDSKTFRTLKYSDCHIDEYKINTLFDKEEGYTGKSGFAIIEDITVSCAGWTTKNFSGEKHDPKSIANPNPYMMGGTTQVITTITLDSGKQEKLNFPVFEQTTSETKVIKKIRIEPAFQLQGVVGDTPLLYKVVDQIRTRGPPGSDPQGLFSAVVDIIHNNKLVKQYYYSKCRVASYDVGTVHNAEEGYIKGKEFALVGTYNMECNGYSPSNPSFEAMNVVEKADTPSTMDLRDTDSWQVGFTVKQ